MEEYDERVGAAGGSRSLRRMQAGEISPEEYAAAVGEEAMDMARNDREIREYKKSTDPAKEYARELKERARGMAVTELELRSANVESIFTKMRKFGRTILPR